jgi:hypothetical protein
MSIFKITLLCAMMLLIVPGDSQKQIAISYTGIDPDIGVASFAGQAVMFTAPTDNWTLSDITICGKLNSSGLGLFALEIWDPNLRTLYRMTDISSYYFTENFSWSQVDIPDLRVPRNFWICIFSSKNINIGANLVKNSAKRSAAVMRDPNRIIPWNLKYPQNSTEWMIEAVGYTVSLPPKVDLSIKSKDKGLLLQAQASNPNGNLSSAMFRVLDSQGDAIWSEQKALSGSQAKIDLAWSGNTFKISNASASTSSVYAFNSLNMPTSMVPYSTYVAPAILLANPSGSEISVSAFFDKEGDMHLLMDSAGSFYYISQELLKVIEPNLPYSEYIKNNLSINEFQSRLTFLKYNEVNGNSRLQPLILDRSAPMHMGIKLDQMEAPERDYRGEVIVTNEDGYSAMKSGNA